MVNAILAHLAAHAAITPGRCINRFHPELLSMRQGAGAQEGA